MRQIKNPHKFQDIVETALSHLPRCTLKPAVCAAQRLRVAIRALSENQMDIRSSPHYGAVTQFLHWATAILALVAFIYGPGVTDMTKANRQSANSESASISTTVVDSEIGSRAPG